MSFNPLNAQYKTAYENVGMLASDVWYRPSDYQRANLNLWIRFNEVELSLVTDDVANPTLTEEIHGVKRSPSICTLSGHVPNNMFPDGDCEEHHNAPQDDSELWLGALKKFYRSLKPLR